MCDHWVSVRVARVAAVLAALAGVGFADKRPIPPDSDVAPARADVKRKFARDYEDTTPAGKRRLASLLLREVERGGGGDAAVWATLAEARDLAVSAGEARLGLHVADVTGRLFDVDAGAMRFAVVQAVVRPGVRLSAGQASEAAREARAMAESRLESEEWEGAVTASAAAVEAVKRSSDATLQAEITLFHEFCRELVRMAPQYREAVKRLEADPDDKAANSRAAEFLMYARREPGRALVMMSRGTDETMRKAATAELSRAKGPDLLSAAGAWEAWAKSRQGPAREIGLLKARSLYTASLPDLDGSDIDRTLEKLATLIGGGATTELADVHAARLALGEARWGWWQSLRAGGLSVREELGDLKNLPALLDWRPVTGDDGAVTPAPDNDARDRLTYTLRVLCTDERGRATVLEESGRVPVRGPDKPLRLTGPSISDIKRYNRGRGVPESAWVSVSFDGVIVTERVWKLPQKSAWWLDDRAMLKRDRR